MLTDLYVMDYDKATGKLLQVLHQTSTATDFAEPDLTLDYGEHVLKVVATRSDNPTLLDATSAPWTVTANVLTPVEDCPTPSVLITDSRYRLPTRLEAAQVLKYADLPEGYWYSKQRILCYDTPADADAKARGTQYGTGEYYTFTPHSTVTRAGMKTKYCVLPLRSERIREKEGVDITVNDEWD